MSRELRAGGILDKLPFCDEVFSSDNASGPERVSRQVGPRIRGVCHLMGASTHCGSMRATMIHDNATYHVLKISELTRLIASHLVLTNQKSAVNLACACRYLEEPTLSILWGAQQWSLCTLLKVLPKGTWEYPSPDEDVVCCPGPLPREVER